LRAETAAELVQLQKRLGTTFIQVTHDQQEALTMADRIGVMAAGRMIQVGTPREIFEMPANRFVAAFMGVGNLWEGVVLDDGLTMELPGIGTVRLAAGAPRGPAVLGVRAERIRLGVIPDMNQIAGVLGQTTYAGETVTHSVRVGEGTIARITEPAHGAAHPEGAVTLSFEPSACMVFPA
jgi:ABC-type Fe3+/spermidine/putrescine transport system ATPase subunit